MYVLSLDVSMTATGWTIVEVDDATGVVDLRQCGVLVTEKLESGEKVSNTIDSMRRAAVIGLGINKALDDFKAAYPNDKIGLIVVEAMSWPRNAASAIKMSMAWGALAPILLGLQVPVIEVGPQEIKKVVASSRSATKKEVEGGVRKRIPAASSEVLEHLIPKRALREHCWDALGAVLAAQKTEKWALLRAGRQAASPQL